LFGFLINVMKILSLKLNNKPLENKRNQPAFKGLGSITHSIQSNTLMNRAFLSVFGFSIPFAFNANSKAERNERYINSVWYTAVAFLSPILILPFINKQVLKKGGIVKKLKDKGVDILKVSKEYLNKDASKMMEGIKKKGKELGLQKEFDELLEKFPDKEKLRKKLIDCHKNIFKWDFLTTSVAVTANPWITNIYTRLATGRTGYAGEFEMTDKNYTKKQTVNHEKNRYKKMIVSFAIAIAPALIIPGFLAKAMKKNPANLKGLSKWINQNAQKFDYKDAKYMSLLTYATMWTTGDYPTYLLACRDKHELKYKAISNFILGAFYFAGDKILNSLTGRAFDRFKGTKIMNPKGYEKAGFFKKLFMPMKPLKEIMNITGKIGKKTGKYAIGMYWGNLALTAAIIGVGMPRFLNVILRKDVKSDLAKEKSNNIYNSMPPEAKNIFKYFIQRAQRKDYS